MQHNLEAEYGKSSIPESKKADEEHFIYKPEENEISLFVMMRDARFYISPDYRYFPKEHQVSLKNNMQKIKETCIKQREGYCVLLPVSVQVHHAGCDGFHAARFINTLQMMCDNILK